jgi:tellurite resistance protein
MTIQATAGSSLPIQAVTHSAALQATNPVDWRAIFAGALSAAAISVLLLGFGSGIGLSLTSARPYAGLSASLMALLITLWFAIVHVGSFAAGGYLAARLRASTSASAAKGAPNVEREFRDGAHGFLVWALGTLLGAALIAGSLISVSKGTAEFAASAVSAGATSAAANRTAGGPSVVPDPLGYAIDTLLRRPVGASPATGAAVPRDEFVNAEIARILVMGVSDGALNPLDRQHLVGLIAQRTGLPQADADKRFEETWTRYRSLRADAETRVRDAAEKARRMAVITAFLAAAVSLAALVAAIWGADAGAADRDINRSFRFLGRDRFW